MRGCSAGADRRLFDIPPGQNWRSLHTPSPGQGARSSAIDPAALLRVNSRPLRQLIRIGLERIASPAGSKVGDFGPDHLTFDLDESSRLSLSFYGKQPGPDMTLEKVSMHRPS